VEKIELQLPEEEEAIGGLKPLYTGPWKASTHQEEWIDHVIFN